MDMSLALTVSSGAPLHMIYLLPCSASKIRFGIFLDLPEGAPYTFQMLSIIISAKQMEERLKNLEQQER